MAKKKINKKSGSERVRPTLTALPTPSDVSARMYAAMPDTMRGRLVRCPRDPNPHRQPISAALLDVAEPWLTEAHDSGMAPGAYKEWARTVCNIAIYAWNLTLIDDLEEREKGMDGLLEVIGGEFDNNYSAVLAWAEILVAMIDRVTDRYPSDMRTVVGYEIEVDDNCQTKLHATCFLPEVPEGMQEIVDPAKAALSVGDTSVLGRGPAAQIVDLDLASMSDPHQSEAPDPGSGN